MSASSVTYNDLIVEALGRYRDREAFVDGDRRVSYRQAASYLLGARFGRGPSVRHVLTFGPADIGDDLFVRYDSTPGSSLRPADVDTEHIAWVRYTGGTTGRAKGVMLAHRALVAQTLSTSSTHCR